MTYPRVDCLGAMLSSDRSVAVRVVEWKRCFAAALDCCPVIKNRECLEIVLSIEDTRRRVLRHCIWEGGLGSCRHAVGRRQ